MKTREKPQTSEPETWKDCLSLAPKIQIPAEDIAVAFGILVPTEEVDNLNWDKAWVVFRDAKRGSKLEREAVSRLLGIASSVCELEAILRFVNPGSALARMISKKIEGMCKQKLSGASTLGELRVLLHDCPFGSEVRSLVVKKICFETKL